MASRRKRLVNLLAAAASVITIGLPLASWLSGAPSGGRHGIIILSTLAGLAGILLVWQEFRYSRKAKYAESLDNIRTMLKIVAEHSTTTTQECKNLLQLLLAEVAEAFTLSSATRVSAVLKQLVSPNGATLHDFYVEDICRDPKSSDRAGRTNTKHWIDRNTGFKRMFEHVGQAEGKFFYSSDLAKDHHFETTSFETYGRPVPNKGFLDRTTSTWTLPYRSTLTVPLTITTGGQPSLAGFLSIDSRARKAFWIRYDLPFLEAVAFLMRPIVDRYQTLAMQNATTLKLPPNGGT